MVLDHEKAKHYTIKLPLWGCVMESLNTRGVATLSDRPEIANRFIAEVVPAHGGHFGVELDWWLHEQGLYTDSWIVEYLAEGYIDLAGNRADILVDA